MLSSKPSPRTRAGAYRPALFVLDHSSRLQPQGNLARCCVSRDLYPVDISGLFEEMACNRFSEQHLNPACGAHSPRQGLAAGLAWSLMLLCENIVHSYARKISLTTPRLDAIRGRRRPSIKLPIMAEELEASSICDDVYLDGKERARRLTVSPDV